MRSKPVEEARYYYDILGVRPSDNLEFITAAYKRLAKKYHPDISLLPKGEAEEKFKAISEAYRFVRRAKANIQATEPYYGPSRADGPMPAPAPNRSSSHRNEDTWTIICEKNPKAGILYESLARISPRLSEEFRSVVTCDEYCEGLEEIAAILEEEYFTKYFGHHHDIHQFAKWLIMNNYAAPASELNSEIINRGELKDPGRLIEKISKSHNLSYVRPAVRQFDSADGVDYLLDMTRKIGFWGTCLFVSIVGSFVSGILTASLLSGTRIERDILPICLETVAICAVILAIMLSIFLIGRRRNIATRESSASH